MGNCPGENFHMMLPKDPKRTLIDIFVVVSLAVMLARVLWEELKVFWS